MNIEELKLDYLDKFRLLSNDYYAYGVEEIIREINDLVEHTNKTDEEKERIKELQDKIGFWNSKRIQPILNQYKKLQNLGIKEIDNPLIYQISPLR